MIKKNESEIINQKKQFIFEVEQTSDYVFPNEEYKYFIYIKNISGSKIEKFNILIKNNPEIHFNSKEDTHFEFNLDPDEVILFEIKGVYCQTIGEHTVHFIGFGEGTELLYETLIINCTRVHNSNNLIHRLHIYDFSPYEDKYSMEADNYSNSVTQTFKRQKLPYRPTKKDKQIFSSKRNFISENIESESLLEQYKEARNKNEHVYQYISRENFTEDSLESYTGENLYEIFEKINKNSEYFKGKFFRTGTNHLLNNFTQYSPNGFLHRMGLLNSEIYHNLGVIPTYTYMSDRLFRWAPQGIQPLNLIPEKKAMKWGENIWAGRGWVVYKTVTDEYKKTDKYANEIEEKLIKNEEIINVFEDKRVAEETIQELKKRDKDIRDNEKSDIIKFKYTIHENLYDSGVFFVNIPVNKIPSNFYLMKNEDLYALINRAKPCGTKPIINYIIEATFNQHMDQKITPNYYEKTLFTANPSQELYSITKSKYGQKEIQCENDNKFSYITFIPTQTNLFKIFNNDINLNVDISDIQTSKCFDDEMKQESFIYETKPEHKLITLKDVIETLYQGNYNTLSFKINYDKYSRLYSAASQTPLEFHKDNDNNIYIEEDRIQSLKCKIHNYEILNEYKEGDMVQNIVIEDVYNRKHKFEAKYDTDLQMDFITYSYINTNDKEFIRERGYQNVQSLVVAIRKMYNKIMLLFLIEDENKALHYFHHVIVQDVKLFTSNKSTIEYDENIFAQDVIFETPFIKKSKILKNKLIKGGYNWNNLYRFNDKTTSYSYIKNTNKNYLPVDDIYLYYDNIDIPETAIIDNLRLKTIGISSPDKQIYIENALNTNHISKEVNGYKLQLSPNVIEAYSHLKESSIYYEIKLKTAKEKEQYELAKEIEKKLEENYLFDEDMDLNRRYMDSPNDFLTIKNQAWYELYDFTEKTYNLNNISSIKLVIEGYNPYNETKIIAETLSETSVSSQSSKKIPAGYFREKINLNYPNNFLLNLLRVRFRFEKLNHSIKIFDTKIELKFTNKENSEINFDFINEININNKNITQILENYYTPADLNNGTVIKLSFDDLEPGDYYHLNESELEVIYTDTEIDMMINDNKYQDIFYGVSKSSINGIVEDAYLSGIFYSDVPTTIQDEDNVGANNKGIKLQNSIYQMFESHSDNITSIELFPYGFKGNPDETLKIGLYTNSYNTPGDLIKEVCVSGWVKNNESLKNLGRIKYNFNINGLEVGEKYWFKLEIMNPQENNYYLLKGIDNTKTRYKLLADENNNYINTFSNLKFNIYSINLSQSFNHLPVLQEYIDSPYVFIGLHKGKGSIKQLQTNKYIKTLYGDKSTDKYTKITYGNDDMTEAFDDEITMEVVSIIKKQKNSQDEEDLLTEGE